jgi:predicted dehydrogenase
MSKVNVSIIGCGAIAQVHLAALAKCAGQVELAWTIDTRLDAAAEAAKAYGAKHCGADYRDALGPDTDAVIVAVPTHVHSEIAIAALEAGKALFCEKPVARTLAQAEAVRAAVERSQQPTAIGFVRRFDDEWLAFRSAIKAGAIGGPIVWNDIVSFEGPAPAWFGQDEMGGGPFLDGAIHTLDFALYTFGPAKRVFCHGRTMKSGNTAVDTGTASIEFASGDQLVLGWSWGLPKGCAGARVFEFLGPEGMITWPGGVGAPPLPGSADGQLEMREFVVDRGNKKEPIPYPAAALQLGYELQIKEFLSVATGDLAPRANVDDGYEALRLSLAVIESARTGRVVEL